MIAETAPAAAASESPEQKLRSLFYSNDDRGFYQNGEKLLESCGGSTEGTAWFLIQATSSQQMDRLKTLMQIDRLQRTAPDDPWTLAARVYFEGETEPAISIAERAIATSQDEDILLICTSALLQQWTQSSLMGSDSEGKRKLLVAFMDRHREALQRSPNGLAILATAIQDLRPNEVRRNPSDEAVACWNRALAIESSNALALAGKAWYLAVRKQFKEAAELLEKCGLLPSSERLQTIYLGILEENPEVSDDERSAIVEKLARQAVHYAEPSEAHAGFLIAKLTGFSLSCAEALVELILQLYPGSRAAECAHFCRMTEHLDWNEGTAESKRLIAPKLFEFLNRPSCRGSLAESEAWYWLWDLATNGELSTEQSLQALRSGVGDWSLGFVRVLADRKAHLAEIESYARREIVSNMLEVCKLSLVWRHNVPSLFCRYLKWSWLKVADWEDTLGWILLQLGNLDAAELRLNTAKELLEIQAAPREGALPDEGRALLPFVHLARLAMAKGDYATGEEYLNQVNRVPWLHERIEHPAISAYKDLWFQKNGSASGFDAHMAGINDKQRIERKAVILKSRIADPQPIPPFKLATLGGEIMSSEDLKGKIVVIKFWGIWCGGCVKEMPEFQEFVNKYKDDPRVVILTIHANGKVEKIEAYMGKHGYTFTVLLEGEYIPKSKVTGFPTAWFVDANGRKAFEQVGAREELVEEFTWRVEELLNPTFQPSSNEVASAAAQQKSLNSSAVSWKITEIPATVKARDTFNVKLSASIADGCHMYSCTQTAGGPFPMSINVVGGVFKPSEPVIAAKPESAWDKNLEMQVEYYSGEAMFTLPLEVKADAKPGSSELQIDIIYQECSEAFCQPPAVISLKADIEITTRNQRKESRA